MRRRKKKFEKGKQIVRFLNLMEPGSSRSSEDGRLFVNFVVFFISRIELKMMIYFRKF